MSGWTCWKNINEYKGCGDIYVYKIRLIRDGEPVKIGRFLGEDESGLIYIGKRPTKKNDRLKEFKRILEKNSHLAANHSAAKRYLSIKCKIENKFCRCQVQYSYRKLCSKCEASNKEKELLMCYFEKYGEFPPLNRKEG